MELCGGRIYDTMKEEWLLEKDARIVAKQIFEVLVYLHDQNIIHRDIKFENTMVDCDKDI